MEAMKVETRFQAPVAVEEGAGAKLPIPTSPDTVKSATGTIVPCAPEPAAMPSAIEASRPPLQQFAAFPQAPNPNQNSTEPRKLENGTYVLTNLSTGLPIKPEYHPAKSNIICHKDDKSDDFKVGLSLLTMLVQCSYNPYMPRNVMGNSGN